MQVSTQQKIEGRKADFDREMMIRAQERAWNALRRVKARMRPGMTELEATEIAKQELSEEGAQKQWHRPLIRFGSSTLKKFSEPADPSMVLAENDIYFLDFGPVFDGYEGDVGESFTVGDDPEMQRCCEDSRGLFKLVSEKWRSDRISGQALYAFAAEEARKLGWVLHPDVDGHRVSEFPHQVYFRGGLGELDFIPSPHLWILEIQLRHPTRQFGAFYEDLLL